MLDSWSVELIAAFPVYKAKNDNKFLYSFKTLVFQGSKLVFGRTKTRFSGTKTRFSGIKTRFSGTKTRFSLLYRITNRTKISNNTKIVLSSRKRHLGWLTRLNRAETEKIRKGKKRSRKNKSTKRGRTAGGGKL
jgi:hypothetical protein